MKYDEFIVVYILRVPNVKQSERDVLIAVIKNTTPSDGVGKRSLSFWI